MSALFILAPERVLNRHLQWSVQKVSLKPSGQTLMPLLVIRVSEISSASSSCIFLASCSGSDSDQCTKRSTPASSLSRDCFLMYLGICMAAALL